MGAAYTIMGRTVPAHYVSSPDPFPIGTVSIG